MKQSTSLNSTQKRIPMKVQHWWVENPRYQGCHNYRDMDPMQSGSRQLAPIIWKPRHDWEEAEEMSISWECGQFELPSRSPRRVAGMSLEMRSINSQTCLSSSQKLPGFNLRSYLIVCFHPTAFIIHKDRDHISLVPCCICNASYTFAKWGVYEYTHTHTSNEISLLEACTLCISPQKSSERRVWWDLMQACDLTRQDTTLLPVWL